MSEATFSEVMSRLKAKEGYSDETARKVAAKIGREAIGQKEMTERSIEGKKEESKGKE